MACGGWRMQWRVERSDRNGDNSSWGGRIAAAGVRLAVVADAKGTGECLALGRLPTQKH